MSDADKLVRELRNVRKISGLSISRSRQNYNKKAKMKKKNNNRCTYCKGTFREDELYVVQKYFTPLKETGEFGKNNEVVACRRCKIDKNSKRLDHHEFIKFLYNERQKKRKEFVKNHPQIVKKIFKKYDYKCIYCEFEYGYTPENRKLTLDHKKSIFRRGENKEKNFCAACENHNHEKGGLTATEFFAKLEKQGRKTTNKTKTL